MISATFEEDFESINHSSKPPIPENNRQITPRSTETSEARELKSTEFMVSMNLFKAFIGIGVLTLGYGVRKAGLIQANLLMFIGASFTFWSINLLITIVEKMNIRITSLDQLSYLILGSFGACITKFCVIVLQIGTAITYVYYFGVFFRNLFCFFQWQAACQNLWISLILVLFLIIPLHAIRTLTKYYYFSLIANILIVSSLLGVVFYLAFYMERNEEDNSFNYIDISFFPAFFGVSLFSIESLSIVLEIRDSMKNPLLFRHIFMRQFIIIVILYTILPTLFYLFLGEEIKEIVLFNIPIENPFGFFIQSAYGIALCLSYPLQMYPVFLIIEKILRKNPNFLLNDDIYRPETQEENKKIYRLKWITCRIVLCLLLVFVAYLIPDFAWFLNILGAVGSTILGMILPVVLAEKYFIIMGNHKEVYSNVNRYGNICTMIIGLFGGGLATYYSLDYMIGKP